MDAKAITPILNISDLKQSFAWFEKLGWKVLWGWGEPESFGAVGSGVCEIFLCVDGQGGRGKGSNTSTFGENGDETQDQGVWMSVWVDDVDAVYALAVEKQIDVVFPPTDLPWQVRDCHLRHPDGHILRLSQSIA